MGIPTRVPVPVHRYVDYEYYEQYRSMHRITACRMQLMMCVACEPPPPSPEPSVAGTALFMRSSATCAKVGVTPSGFHSFGHLGSGGGPLGRAVADAVELPRARRARAPVRARAAPHRGRAGPRAAAAAIC